MTPDTPTQSPADPSVPADQPDLTLPPTVEAILDEASVENGPYSALPLSDRVQLVETRTGKVVREALWPHAGAWRANLLRAALSTVGTPVAPNQQGAS